MIVYDRLLKIDVVKNIIRNIGQCTSIYLLILGKRASYHLRYYTCYLLVNGTPVQTQRMLVN